jgi:hypothetical protein
MAQREKFRVRAALDWLRRLFRREPGNPGDPHAYVGAPRRPRTPQRSAAALAEWPEE